MSSFLGVIGLILTWGRGRCFGVVAPSSGAARAYREPLFHPLAQTPTLFLCRLAFANARRCPQHHGQHVVRTRTGLGSGPCFQHEVRPGTSFRTFVELVEEATLADAWWPNNGDDTWHSTFYRAFEDFPQRCQYGRGADAGKYPAGPLFHPQAQNQYGQK